MIKTFNTGKLNLTCLVVIVHFDHSWFEILHWKNLFQLYLVIHWNILMNLREETNTPGMEITDKMFMNRSSDFK